VTSEGAPPLWRHLRELLLESGRLEAIEEFDASSLSIYPPDVLARIQEGDPSWEAMVPAPAAEAIKAKRLFGYAPPK
jgi:hypothetical protein